MNFVTSFLLGLVEGVTEFLPISSTFHLLTFGRLLGLTQSDFLSTFEVVIQGGAILSLLILYGQTILTNQKLLRMVITSFLPTAVVGFVLYKLIKGTLFAATGFSLAVFILVGVAFLVIEAYVKQGRLTLYRSTSELTYSDALVIGIAQSLAVIPGVSRSGSVILIMMFLGFRRQESARYTFLLSLPTILSASGLDLIRHPELLTSTSQVQLLGVGFVTAFITAYFVMRWLLQYLSTHSLTLFGYYRIVVGLLLLFFFMA